MAYAYRNLKNPQNIASGIADYVLLAPVSDFAEGGIMCPEGPYNNPGDEVIVKNNHVFKAGKEFVKFLLAPEKNELSAKTIGDLGFQKLDFELKIFVPGSYAEAHEAVKNIINTPLIVLAKDSNCPANMYYQLGCDCIFAWAKFDFSTGTTKNGNKGYDGTITYQNGYVQLYAGGLAGGGGGGNPSTQFTAFWGVLNDGDALPNAAAIAASPHHAVFNKGAAVVADFTYNHAPKRLWMAEPSTEPAKTVWYGDPLNNGPIGPDETFGAPTTVAPYRLYVTTFDTENESTPIQFRVS